MSLLYYQFIEDHIKQVAISLLRRISMTSCIGVWITLDSKLHLQKVPIVVPKVPKKTTFGTTIGTF